MKLFKTTQNLWSSVYSNQAIRAGWDGSHNTQSNVTTNDASIHFYSSWLLKAVKALCRSDNFWEELKADLQNRLSEDLRILIVIPNSRVGATGRYTQVLAEQLVQLGAMVMILAEGGVAKRENGVYWLPLEFKRSFLTPGLRSKIRLFQPNIVYENGVRSRAQRAALEAVCLTGAHLVMQSEDDDVQIYGFRRGEKSFERLTLLDKSPLSPSEISQFLGCIDWAHSLKVFRNPAYDRWVEPLLRAACYHLAEAHTAIWHPFVQRLESQYGKPTLVVPPVCEEGYFEFHQLSESRRAEFLSDFKIPADCTVFFIAGTIYGYSEEFMTFLSAMNLAASKTSHPLCLVVAGRGWKGFARIAEKTLSGSDVLFLNLKKPDDARYLRMLQAADIVCSPGVNDDFTRYRLPSRLVKAMAMGKPVLTAKWGFGESLQDGVNAFLTDGNHAEGWASTILAATDAHKRIEVGRRGKMFAEANFRPGPVSEKLLELFQGIVCGSFSTEIAVRS